jgi:hypothetical protein
VTLNHTYPTPSASSITLDTLANAANFFAGKWSPELKRNQSRDVLRAVINKLYGASRGSMFYARMKCSHAALAATVDLSRPWTSELISRLRDAGWLRSSAPRLPDGTQEISTFRPGPLMKRLLVMLLKSKQRPTHSRVNDSRQRIPSKEQIEKNLHFLRQVQEQLAQKLGRKT